MAADVSDQVVRWERARTRHDEAISRAGMVPFRAGRRLRYACLTPAGPVIVAIAVLTVAGYAGWQALHHGTDAASVGRAAALAALLVAAATNRASVTETGLSFDVAGLRRIASFGFVPLYAVVDVAVGNRPAGWPRGVWHGNPFPGLGRVHVRYTSRDGVERVRSAWVRDPRRYADAVLGGRPEPKRRRRRPGRRR